MYITSVYMYPCIFIWHFLAAVASRLFGTHVWLYAYSVYTYYIHRCITYMFTCYACMYITYKCMYTCIYVQQFCAAVVLRLFGTHIWLYTLSVCTYYVHMYMYILSKHVYYISINRYVYVYGIFIYKYININMYIYTYMATPQYVYIYIYIYIYGNSPAGALRLFGTYVRIIAVLYIIRVLFLHMIQVLWYGVALVSRIDKIVGLFCKRAL